MFDYIFRKNEKANTYSVYIPAYNREVNVNPLVYMELTRSVWREEKQDISHAKRNISLSTQIDENISLEDMIADSSAPSPELEFIAKERAKDLAAIISMIKSILTEDQYSLLAGVLTETEYASRMGISQPAAHKQKIKLLSHLREEIDKEYDEELLL